MIGLIERAIIERVKAASTLDVLGYKLREVDSLPADFDSRLPEYIKSMPAVWTVFGGFRATDQLAKGAARGRAEFHLVVGAQNLRNERATRFGGSDAEVGTYQLVLDMAGLVVGQTFGLPMSPFELVNVAPLYSEALLKERRANLMSVGLATTFVLDPRGEDVTRAPIDDFARFHVAWDIRPFGGVNLPSGDDDGGGDAADHVQLETLP